MKEFCNISSESTTQTTDIQKTSTTTVKKTIITARMTMTSSVCSTEQINGTNVAAVDAAVAATTSTPTPTSTTVTKEKDDSVEFMEVEENTSNEEEMNNGNYTLNDVPILVKKPLKLNEYWYIVDKKWFDLFLAYLENKENYPGKIDNSCLLTPAKNVLSRTSEPSYRLKTNVQENEDFVIVPEEAWNLLVETFGTVEGMGGHPIRCPTIQRTESYLQVELNPLELRLTLYGSKEVLVVQYSRNCTLREVITEMKKLFHIDDNKPIQLWNNATLLVSHSDDINNRQNTNNNNNDNNNNNNNNNNNDDNSTFLSSLVPRPPPPPPPSNSKTVSSVNQRLLDIVDVEAPNTILTIEMKNNDNTWPSSKTKGAVTRSKLASGIPNCPPGVCGLMNLGNTCFMNAALQCLSNTAPLTKYFLSDHHLADINPDNPLGMRGEIARCYSELIKSMWSGFHSSIAPRDFKIAVTQFAPQFSGFAHHDCQELMAFLLDGLHEDLNRVKVKPYIEMKNDIERRPDEIVAMEAWKNYKLRNDSIIVDTFHAQLKSTLVCPECELVSVTFDPFCYLTLPLPYRIERPVDIIFVPAISKRPNFTKNPVSCATTSNEFVMNTIYNSKPVRSFLLENIMIPKAGCASDISAAVVKFLNECNRLEMEEDNNSFLNRKFDPKKLVVAHIINCSLNKIFAPSDIYISNLDDIVVYELDDIPTTINSESGCQTRSSSKFNGHHIPVFIQQINENCSESVIGRPFFINIKSLSYENIREAIFKELITLVSPEKINGFFQTMIENIAEDEEDNISSSTNSKQFQRNSQNNGGSDGEASDVDDEDMIQINNDSINYSDDEGVETFSSFPIKKNTSYPSFTITLVTPNAQTISVLTPGVRLESSNDNYLAINIHHKIVRKFFPNNINRCGYVRLSSMLRNLPPSNNNNSALTLKECINQFTLTEKLGENDPWYCPRCKKHQMASKKFDIWSLPNNLIIHLKRFSYSRSHRDKLNVLVEFPIENLDMSPYVLHNPNNESFIYDLIAVSNHYGEMGGGHYNANAKNFMNNNWFLFDDYSITLVSDEKKVMTKAAYVLFYQRKRPPANMNVIDTPPSSPLQDKKKAANFRSP